MRVPWDTPTTPSLDRSRLLLLDSVQKVNFDAFVALGLYFAFGKRMDMMTELLYETRI